MSATKKSLFPVPIETALLGLVAILLPIGGGQASMRSQPMTGGFLDELMGGPALPLTFRFLCGLILCGLTVYLLATKKVVQLARPRFNLCLLGTVSLLLICSAFSPFPWQGLTQGLTWVVAALCFFLAVQVSGRREAQQWMVGCIGIGLGILALIGFAEYVSMVKIDPSHRIFARWNNPNAVATAFLIAVPIWTTISARGDRIWKLIGPIAGGLAVACLWFTGSKGGLVAFLIGAIALAIIAAQQKVLRLTLKSFGLTVAVGLGLIVLVNPRTIAAVNPPPIQARAQTKTAEPVAPKPTPAPAPAPAAPRQLDSGGQATQSFAFRIALWKSTIQLITRHPMGIGAGNFQYFSAQPGLVEQTVFSHHTWLQIGLEGSLLALVCMVLALAMWFGAMLTRQPNLPKEVSLVRAGVVGAIAATIAHGFIDSNLYSVGASALFFLLLGIGLQTSPTGTMPEVIRPTTKFGGIGACVIAAFLMMVTSQQEIAKSSVMSAIARKDAESVAGAVESIKSFADTDGEAAYMVGLYGSRSEQERLDNLKKAVALFPTTRNMRALADTYSASGDSKSAIQTLQKALDYDPNNLRTLANLMRTASEANDKQTALDTANRLLKIEETSFFKVRSIPELVPTETYEARMFLAKQTASPAEKVKLLLPAVRGYVEFKRQTLYRINLYRQFGTDFGGVSLEQAKGIMANGRECASMLRDAAQLSGDAGALATSTEALRELTEGSA